MRAIAAEELLGIWDRGTGSAPVHRVLDLLSAAYPERSREWLAREPVGARDRRLLDLRENLFGSEIASVALCPACGERLDLNFLVDDIRLPVAAGNGEPLMVDAGGYRLLFRLPDSLDLASLPIDTDAEGARDHLLRRCLLSAERDGEPAAGGDLPGEVLDLLLAGMGEADPQADLQMSLACPACGHSWSAIFDIVSYLWNEIDLWARGMTREVHILARAYGWSEKEILAVSPRRRRIYLAMATQ